MTEAIPEPLPEVFNVQFVVGNGLGQVLVQAPRHVMTRAEALEHAAWLVAIADPDGTEFDRYLAAVRST